MTRIRFSSAPGFFLGTAAAVLMLAGVSVAEAQSARSPAYTAARAAGQAGKSTIQEYAFTTGCKLIRDTRPGEKYQGLDGSWKTRGAGAPELDPRCP
jgi:uncharacterized protein YdbL (DUF1318 family)